LQVGIINRIKYTEKYIFVASMPATIRQYKAACVQAEPGWFDLEKSVKKTVDLILEAGEKKCKLVAFPETCKCSRKSLNLTKPLTLMVLGIPGCGNHSSTRHIELTTLPARYPYWQWRVTYQDSLPLLKEYHQNSLKPESEEMNRIRAAAKAAQIYVSLGYSEIDGNSLYMAQVIINPLGQVINHRRKIKPTHVERLVFGEGTGDSLNSVVETEIGALGHLNCWENVRHAFVINTLYAFSSA
jgi:cyanide hydratase